MLTIGFIGNFMPNAPQCFSTECDRKWSFEKLKHRVIMFQEDRTSAEQLIQATQYLNMLVYSHTHGLEIKDLIGVFETYKSKNIPVITVHLDRWAWLARESDIGKEASWHASHIFMADASPEAVELYKKHNLNWYYLKPGVVERDCYIAKPDRQRFPQKIIFVGSKNYHSEYPFRKELIEWLQSTYGTKFGHYGCDGLGVVRGYDLNVLYASAKIAVGDSCFGSRPNYVSDRYYETRGRGGFLLHPHTKGVDSVGVGHYAKENLLSLRTAIDWWLEHDDERELMRHRGFEYVRDNETYTHRAHEMLTILKKERAI
jgi:hypothetical protein